MAETPLSAGAVYSARPTVRVDGRDDARVRELLVSMELVEREGGMSALELALTNVASDPAGAADYAFEDDAVLTLGAALTVLAGDEDDPAEIFRGVVTAVEGDFPAAAPPRLVVLAEDACQRARMTRRTAVHEDRSVAALVRDVAERAGLRAQVTALDEAATEVQLDESDLAFLRRLLERHDADLQVVADELHAAPRASVRRGTVELALHSQLRSARVTADLAHQTTEVTVAGWSVRDGAPVTGRSRGAQAGPGAGRTGAAVLRDTLGERPHHLSRLPVASADEARAAADAAFDARARRFVVAEGTAEGNPRLRVGTHVLLRGLGARFDNTYYVTEARHRFDLVRGYETEFVAECAYWGAP